MVRASGFHGWTLVAAAFAFVVFFFAVDSTDDKCSKTCVTESCNTVGIRYGKYCGVGWSGCPGEKPCDDVDACCQIHDYCTHKKGLTNVKCHEDFKTCIKGVQKTGKVGFSSACSYNTVVRTMTEGMDMAILFSQFGNKFDNLIGDSKMQIKKKKK